MDEIRDFLAIHYAFNTRLDTPFWHACRTETHIGGAQRVVDFYKENGPSLLIKAVMNPQNCFGINGYLALLCGQQVPHQSPHQPTPAEQEKWQAHYENLAKASSRALTGKEAGAAVTAPSWCGPDTATGLRGRFSLFKAAAAAILAPPKAQENHETKTIKPHEKAVSSLGMGGCVIGRQRTGRDIGGRN